MPLVSTHLKNTGSKTTGLERKSEPIDLLVTDVRLTGRMNGWELAAAARNARPELAVIYLSANPPSPDRYVDGAVFIDKPALMDEVIAVARQLLAIG